jgi:hypothetical protein
MRRDDPQLASQLDQQSVSDQFSEPPSPPVEEEARVEKLEQQVENLRQALEPFAAFASEPGVSPKIEANPEHPGAGQWTPLGVGVSRDRIRDWFGPSDFFDALAAVRFTQQHPTPPPVVADAVMSDQMQQLVGQLLAEVRVQEEFHPAGFPPDRNGIRAGIAAVEDETREALESWHLGKRHESDPERWNPVRAELLQVAAVALRTIRDLPRECNCDGGSGPGHSWNCPASTPPSSETKEQGR